MHEQDASAMLEKENRRDLHWRQPWTSDSLGMGSEMKTINHPIGRATDICPWSSCFYCWFVKTGTIYCQRSQSFFPCHKGIKGAFQNLLQALRVYTLRSFISYHVGEPTKCWWATDTNVAGKAVGMQQTSWLWQNFSVAVQAEKQHTCNPSIFVRDYYWTTVERKEVFQFLPVCQ